MKIIYIFAALLSMIILFSSLPVSAAEVSGNDANNGIMLLSADNGTATAGTYYPNIVDDSYVQKNIELSNFTDVINLEMKLFDIYISNDPDWNSNGSILNLFIPITYSYDNNNLTFEDSEIFDVKYYFLVDGKKYYFNTVWTSIVPDQFFIGSVITCYAEVSIKNNNKPANSKLDILLNSTESNGYGTSSGYVDLFEYRSGYSIPLKITWSGVEWDLVQSNITNSGLLSGIKYTLKDIITNITILKDNVVNKFSELFNKMDEDQEEIINGYDPNTGNDAGSNFDSSAADLGAAEDSLFEAASYDNIDYSEFEGFFSLSGVSAALSFLKTLMESLYSHLGIFGVPLTIGLILLVITRILGYQNFTAGGG